jgi:hypothetical protein
LHCVLLVFAAEFSSSLTVFIIVKLGVLLSTYLHKNYIA